MSGARLLGVLVGAIAAFAVGYVFAHGTGGNEAQAAPAVKPLALPAAAVAAPVAQRSLPALAPAPRPKRKAPARAPAATSSPAPAPSAPAPSAPSGGGGGGGGGSGGGPIIQG